MKAAAKKLNVAPVVLQPTELEVKASKIIPKATAKVTANGYQGYREFITAVPAEVRAKYPVNQAGDTSELSRLCNGKNSALDIKKALDAQAQGSIADLQHVMNYLEILKAAGLVEIPEPSPVKGGKPVKK
jgi:hypothetical protein